MDALRAIGLSASWASSAVSFGAVGLTAGTSPFSSASPVSDDNSDSGMVVSFGVTLGLFKGLKKLLIFALPGGALFFFDEGALAFSAFWHGPDPTCCLKFQPEFEVSCTHVEHLPQYTICFKCGPLLNITRVVP